MKITKVFILVIVVTLLAVSAKAQVVQCNKARYFNDHKPGSQGSPKALLPDNYDLKYCKLMLEVDPAVKFIRGAVQTMFFHDSVLSEIQFELSDSLVADSAINNGNLQQFIHTGNILKINLDQPLIAGSFDSVTVYYHGVPAGNTGFGAFASEIHGPNNVPVMWTLSQPFGAKDWWPCKQDLNDKIDSVDMEVTAPSIYKVASNGLLVSELTSGNLKTTRWSHHYPIAAYLIAFAVTDYTIFNNQVNLSAGTLNVLNYVYPESVSDAQNAMAGLLEVFRFLDSLYVPYPFMNEKYGHAQFNWGGGMEHQTMTFVGGFSYELLAHELAHHWWGDNVTCGSWSDIWLNEGFATYSPALCYERFSPGLYWKIWKRDQVSFITSSPDGSVYVTDTLNNPRLFDARLTYSKGAMLLHGIRWKIGDDDFFNALRIYQNSPLLVHAYSRTTDLKNIFESVSGQNLDEFFNDWFYGEGYPSYQIIYSQNLSNEVTCTINQTQSHPSVNYFEMKLPLKFKNAASDTIVVVNNTFSGETYTIPLNFQADSLILDPDNWIVCNQNQVTKIRETDKLISTIKVHPNPCRNLIRVNCQAGFNNNSVQIKITDITGKALILPKQYEQLNNNTLEITTDILNAGVYLLEVTSGDKIYRTKFSKI